MAGKLLDDTGLAALWARVKAEDAKDGKVAFGTYKGTGTYGSSNPNTLTFSFEPKMVMIVDYSRSDTYASTDYSYNETSQNVVFLTKYRAYGQNYNTNGSMGYRLKVKFNGKTVSWYTTASDATCQANHTGSGYDHIYGYIAIG